LSYAPALGQQNLRNAFARVKWKKNWITNRTN